VALDVASCALFLFFLAYPQLFLAL